MEKYLKFNVKKSYLILNLLILFIWPNTRFVEKIRYSNFFSKMITPIDENPTMDNQHLMHKVREYESKFLLSTLIEIVIVGTN